ncbi:hypothetical protein Tdes44962_MAKER09809 [Teratosphaeria destructans]|uniref:Uncharacterized protein n=1 Tax=Teratosphaeria destructans TaxID=418781 RepID=A0A9W7SR23_9PEZI|nr:hypothetical protein Tdes44962_MAKER09809 [Teratosphaeria destructans]
MASLTNTPPPLPINSSLTPIAPLRVQRHLLDLLPSSRLERMSGFLTEGPLRPSRLPSLQNNVRRP